MGQPEQLCDCGLPCKKAVYYGVKCGCIFHKRCVDRPEQGCPRHGVCFGLEYTKTTCFVAGCSAPLRTEQSRGSVGLCKTCTETLMAKIILVLTEVAGLTFEELFSKLFCGDLGLWPPFLWRADVGVKVEHDDTGAIVSHACNQLHPLLVGAWNCVLAIVASSPDISIIFPSSRSDAPSPGLWHTPWLLYYGLATLPINRHSFDAIFSSTGLPADAHEGAQTSFRLWIRGKGENLVVAFSDRTYRLLTRLNITTKVTLIRAITKTGGVERNELWGEHPDCFRWLNECVADGSVKLVGSRAIASVACLPIPCVSLIDTQCDGPVVLRVATSYPTPSISGNANTATER